MCFKENTALELMLSDGKGKNFPEDVEEVFLSPGHVVRNIKDFQQSTLATDLKTQLAKDELNLPLSSNSQPSLEMFIGHQVIYMHIPLNLKLNIDI